MRSRSVDARGEGLGSEEIMSIATRKLGSTGLEITEVGFGAWAIGGGEWTRSATSQDVTRAIEQTGVGGGPIEVVASVG
jgi:hypothetical protein